MNENTHSIEMECNKRLETLYQKHNQWLGAVAFNICKDNTLTEDLVSDLYLYLGEKCNPKLFYLDSYNLQYCRQFILSRFINKKNKDKRQECLGEDIEIKDDEYDIEYDLGIDRAYEEVKDELQRMKKKKGWAQAMIYEEYWFSDRTLDEVSKDIGISKSTTYLSVKSVKKQLKQIIQNPFKNDE